MSEPLNNTPGSPRRSETAGGTIAVGQAVTYTAARTVSVVGSGQIAVGTALSSATVGESVDVFFWAPAIRMRCQGNISAGGKVEVIDSGGDAGKVQTQSARPVVGIAAEGASDEGLVLVQLVLNASIDTDT